MEYYDIYLKRLNRYGENFQERLQGQREAEFEEYLKKTVYKVQFMYNEKLETGSLEKYRQDDTRTLQYLLTHIDLNMPGGTILEIPDKDGNSQAWMVFYLEHIEASGYNRYIMLRMTHFIDWLDEQGGRHESWAYLYGQKNSDLRDTLKSAKVIYSEDQKSSYFIMPRNEYIKKDLYLEVGTEPFELHFRVTGYDYQSTEGVEYVTLDPIYKYDRTPAPTKPSGDTSNDFYWLGQG